MYRLNLFRYCLTSLCLILTLAGCVSGPTSIDGPEGPIWVQVPSPEVQATSAYAELKEVAFLGKKLLSGSVDAGVRLQRLQQENPELRVKEVMLYQLALVYASRGLTKQEYSEIAKRLFGHTEGMENARYEIGYQLREGNYMKLGIIRYRNGEAQPLEQTLPESYITTDRMRWVPVPPVGREGFDSNFTLEWTFWACRAEGTDVKLMARKTAAGATPYDWDLPGDHSSGNEADWRKPKRVLVNY